MFYQVKIPVKEEKILQILHLHLLSIKSKNGEILTRKYLKPGNGDFLANDYSKLLEEVFSNIKKIHKLKNLF